MQTSISLNYVLSKEIGKNIYLNTYASDRNHYMENVSFVDYWDIDCKKVCISPGHNFLNEYNYYINNGKFYEPVTIKSTITNDKTTNKYILFFVCFDDIPFDINVNEVIHRPTDESLNNSERIFDTIASQVKVVSTVYPNATILVSSPILRYGTVNSKQNDKLKQKIFDLNLDNVVYDYTFDISELNPESFFAVVTNKESNIFVYCAEKDIPVIIYKKTEAQLCDLQLYKYFNELDQEDLHIYNISMDEFEIQDDNKNLEPFEVTFDISNSNKMIQNRTFLNTTLFTTEPFSIKSTPFKVHLYQDSMILKDLFSSDKNKELFSLTEKIDDENTIVVTLNLHNSFHMRCRKNKKRMLNWLCFDFDTLHKESVEKYMRFYYKSYALRVPIYNFTSLDEIKSKFNIEEIKTIDYNVNGNILVIFDNPFGANYTSKQHWVNSWMNIFDQLVSKLGNKNVIIKPYFKNKIRQKEINQLYYDNFTQYENVRYAEELLYVDLKEIIQTNDIYFAIKRQGTEFLKAYTNGIIMLSGLNTTELESKPDGKFVNEYEYTLSNVLSNIDNKLDEIKEFYNTNTLENLKKMTANFVAIEDIQNGTLFTSLKNSDL